MEPSKRHSLISLLFILNCLSKTLVITNVFNAALKAKLVAALMRCSKLPSIKNLRCITLRNEFQRPRYEYGFGNTIKEHIMLLICAKTTIEINIILQATCSPLLLER